MARTTIPERVPTQVTELAAILDDQARGLDRLAAAVRERRRAFVSWRTDDIDDALERLAELIEPLERLDARRSELVDSLCQSVGLPPRSRMRDLAHGLGPHCSDVLVGAVDRVRAAAANARMENAVGAGLLDFAARAQAGLWSELSGGDMSVTYGPDGHDAGSRTGNLIDGTA